jgi:hypothetical protein
MARDGDEEEGDDDEGGNVASTAVAMELDTTQKTRGCGFYEKGGLNGKGP